MTRLSKSRPGATPIDVSDVRPSPPEGLDTKVCPRCGTRYGGAAAFCQKDGARLEWAGAEPDPYIGRDLLGQFRIVEALGAGGMGRVYRARQTTLDRDVAIKILHSDLVQNPDAVRRFRREAPLLAGNPHRFLPQ